MNNHNDYSVVANQISFGCSAICTLVDSVVTLELTEFLHQVYCLLPELIYEATRLPKIESDEVEGDEQGKSIYELRVKARMDHEEWSRLYNTLKQKLGPQNSYWQVFDPTKDDEAIPGSVADDLAGIYRDLKSGIDLNQSDRVLPRDTIFEWRFGFYTHCGKRALDALRTIHSLLDETLT